ncbi:hypothetical protein OC846_000737 [Tilletia horrida]|uniref:Photolyase/cryptochrome alpha/beta domain-containing protein n=1 Tax=Tilletia horrida TaxID=155126 RepID=A0AAN6GUM9_9BASI|nr:hypothetical protein OC845_001025 [Tilletia horrida]KAK0557090.1 hypothetical protein OC846_000737 [Tilletia horrida]
MTLPLFPLLCQWVSSAHQSVAPPPLPQLQARAEDGELYSQSEYLVPLYVFDEREIELSGLPAYKRSGPEARTEHYGFWKTGGFRTRFVAECVYDLRTRLQEHGSDLLIRFGIPEVVVENLVKAFQDRGDHVEGVWMQKEMTEPEARVEESIQQRMAARGVPVRFVYGKTLVHPADLPFTINETPDVFTPFRKRVEALGSSMVRKSLKVPKQFKAFLHDVPHTEDYSLDVTFEVDVNGERTDLLERDEKRSGEISFNDILDYLLRPLNAPGQTRPFETQFHLQQRHPASAFPLRGGETSAIERLEWYFVRGTGSDSSRWGKHDAPPVARYKQTRNNLIGHAYSTKMSPFLAYGSVSPRQIWEALDAHDLKFGSNQNTYWVRFELLWRDFFALIANKYGQLLFELGGFEMATDTRQAQKKIEGDWWKRWYPERDPADHAVVRVLEGKTGIPFIDANITELRESGFMSNRGRQNVASFLSKDLSYDWRIGAEFFQSHLIDYDATSNYGNWQYVAGVGNDPRASRQFNIIKQSKTYDPDGEYIKLWVPELRSLTTPVVHHPWTHPREAAKLGGTYPTKPLIESDTWHKHYATPTTPLRGGPSGLGNSSNHATVGRTLGGSLGSLGVGSHNIGLANGSVSSASTRSGSFSRIPGRGPSAALERGGALGPALAARSAVGAGSGGAVIGGIPPASLVSGGPGLGAVGGTGPAAAAAAAAAATPGGIGRGSGANTWFGRGGAAVGQSVAGSARILPSGSSSGSRPSSGAGTAVDHGLGRTPSARFGAATPAAGNVIGGTSALGPTPNQPGTPFSVPSGASSEDVISALTGELRSLRSALDLVTSTLLQGRGGVGTPGGLQTSLGVQALPAPQNTSSDRSEVLGLGSSALNTPGTPFKPLPGTGTPSYPPLSNSPVAGRRPMFGAVGQPAPLSGSPSSSPMPPAAFPNTYSNLSPQPFANAPHNNLAALVGTNGESGEAMDRVRLAEEQGRQLRDQIQQWEDRVRMLVEELRDGNAHAPQPSPLSASQAPSDDGPFGRGLPVGPGRGAPSNAAPGAGRFGRGG